MRSSDRRGRPLSEDYLNLNAYKAANVLLAFFPPPPAGCREGISPAGSFPPLAFRRRGTASPLLSVLLSQRGVIPAPLMFYVGARRGSQVH